MKLVLVNNNSIDLSKTKASSFYVDFNCSEVSITDLSPESEQKCLRNLKTLVEQNGNNWGISASFSISFVPTMQIEIIVRGKLLESLLELAGNDLKVIVKGVLRGELINSQGIIAGTGRNLVPQHPKMYQIHVNYVISPINCSNPMEDRTTTSSNSGSTSKTTEIVFSSEEIPVGKKNKKNGVMATYSVTTTTKSESWTSCSQLLGRISIEVVADFDWLLFQPPPNNTSLLRKILKETILPDFHIVAANQTAIPCHKVVLAAQSVELATMFASGMKESAEAKLELKRGGGENGVPISEEGAHAFLEILYNRQYKRASKSSIVALEILELGQQYGLPEMESTMKTIFLEKSAEWCDVDVALEILHRSCFREGSGYDCLHAKGVQVLKLKCKELADSELYSEFFPEEAGRRLFELTLSI